MSISKKISICAMLTVIALIFGYIEFLFPIPLPIPGIKLGLGNIVILICIYTLNYKYAFFTMLIKVILSTILFASPSMLIYSLSGGILSYLVTILMKRFSFNIITTSIGGGVFHNIGQLGAAFFVLNSINLMYYAPLLILCGIITGALVGIVSNTIINRIHKFYGR